MDILLWRHAEAEDGPDDMNRALTKRGRAQARTMALWVQENFPAESLLLASEASRSTQTAASLAPSMIVMPDLNPARSAHEILESLFDVCKKQSPVAIIIVGHQPALGRLAASLLCGVERDLTIKKGAAWWFRVNLLATSSLGGAELVAAITPRLASVFQAKQ